MKPYSYHLRRLHAAKSAAENHAAFSAEEKARTFFPSLLFPLLGLAVLFCGMCPPDARAAAPVLIWNSDGTEIFALQDRPAEMDVDLFSGPASPEERQKYFSGGKTPASFTSFLIRSQGRLILADTGFGAARPGNSELMEHLSALSIKPENIDFVLLSHMHTDHAGGLLAQKQRAFPTARVLVSKPELEHWLALAAKDPENANAALVKTITEVYGENIAPPFTPGAAILPGITTIDAAGHTPGHVVFRLEAGGKSFLILGDLLHAASLQFPLPEECAIYDMNPENATRSRIKVLSLAAKENIPVAGMHLPFPGTGSVRAAGKGFQFIPSK